MTILAATLVALSALSFAFPLPLTLETDLNEAKALFFDRKYEESRAKWAEIALAPGPNSEAASNALMFCLMRTISQNSCNSLKQNISRIW